jgi:RNA polymerase sigma factor (sigma-70 family)
VIVRDLPTPQPEAEPEPELAVEPPRAIILPANQPVEEREAFMRWLDRQWGGFIHKTLLARRDVLAESAKDLAQHVLLVVCNQYDRREPPVNMRAFLDRVIQNEVRNHRRLRRLEIEPEADLELTLAPGPSPESEADRAERLAKLRRYLDDLSPEEAEVFAAREIDRMTFELIAAALQRPRATVARQHARALEKLAELARASERETALGARVRRAPGA